MTKAKDKKRGWSTVSLPISIVQKIQANLEVLGYVSASEFVRSAVKEYFENHQETKQ